MNILIADDHAIVRQGLKALIEKQSDMKVVGEADNGIDVTHLAAELKPDIIIMDITMPNLNGIEATRRILEENPDTKIIALSMYSHRRLIQEMLKAGALGYVLKSCLFDELVQALQSVARNENYLSPQITNVLVDDYRGIKKPNISVKITLTDKECHIVRLVAEGMSVKQIAHHFKISPKTVDSNRRLIMRKLGISSVAELTKYAIREGLTTLEQPLSQ